MDTRPTKELKTQGGHTILMHTFMTGGEYEAMQDVYLRKMEIGRVEKDGANVSGLTASVATEANHAAIGFMVVSVDGAAAGVVDLVKNLPLPDYREVMSAIEEATSDKKK